MKILIIGDPERYERYDTPNEVKAQAETVFCPRGSSDEELLTAGRDAEVIFADAISPVSRRLIENMPRLRLIQSEGVAFDRIDTEAASARNIYVCNNKGCNAGAVAEQAILLMLGLLRTAVEGHQAVLAGGQIQMKERRMTEGIRELSECRVGLIGFGDIAKATAERLAPFGCTCFYYSRHRKSPEIEAQYGVTYLPLQELLAQCDIVSLHAAVNDETRGMVDAAFLAAMKPTAYLINTARGDLVDNPALRAALLEDRIAGYGLDVIAPEPVPLNSPLVQLPEPWNRRVFFSPHLGGITAATFRRAHVLMWENAGRVEAGEKPRNIVNTVS
ncbi:MAG: 2-hydroxyacid dehydrogenase [Lachnospiraceae bacterium]|nr:2-hydroxyacid dehydrogenase [Lachnospiraceae bacterium]